jgi:Tfp pilus assembly protein PilO
MGIVKMIISALIPYLIDGVKYLFNLSHKMIKRKERKEEAAKRAAAYEAAKTEQEIKTEFENLP